MTATINPLLAPAIRAFYDPVGTPTPDLSQYFTDPGGATPGAGGFNPAIPIASGTPATGGITGPSFDQATGAGSSGKVPDGYIALGGNFAGYFYNPSTDSFGTLEQGADKSISDYNSPAYGQMAPTFAFRRLTATEQKNLVGALQQSIDSGVQPTSAGGGLLGNIGLTDPNTGAVYGSRLSNAVAGGGGGAGGIGSGSGGALTSYQAGELALGQQQNAETARANRVNEAISTLNQIVNQAQIEQAQRQAASSNVLNAAQWAVPAGTDYLPGFGPTSPAVTSGLAGLQKLTRIPFDPYAVQAQTPSQLAAAGALARLQGMLG